MRRLFCVAALMLLAWSTAAQEDTLFQLAQEDAVIVHGPSSAFDGRYTDPGAVIVNDGIFHMFRNGFKAWPATVQIAHHVSGDGINWTPTTEEPVLYTDDVPFAGVAALASGAVVADDGTWMLYLYTWETFSGPSNSKIALATADDPDGPWTVHPEPVLSPGPDGAWDDSGITAPRVFREGDGYVMYYSGSGGDFGDAAIGRATSPDGITWTKHDDPATTGDLYAESDPVFVSPDGERFVHQPAPLQTDDGWVMIYRQMLKRPGPSMELHVATSEDGLTWAPLEESLAWDTNSVPGRFWYTAAVQHEGTTYLYVETGIGIGTDIFAATYTGDFTP
jgi:predicted GH43/DUF377 family glycosyl hydrolase